MHIREATDLDRDDIQTVYRSAFPESEAEAVSKIAVDLLSEDPQTISLVAELDAVVVGHVAFSPVSTDSDVDFRGYILAPLAVKPDYHGRRIGVQLVESGMQQLSTMNVDCILVYGDPDYYSRFGFSVDAAERYIPPYKLEYPFGWQGIALNKDSAEKPSTNIVCVAPLCDPALW